MAGEAIALLAKRGAGKTHSAIVLAEEMLDAGVQIVVLDPVGSWWGLRSKYEIPILGGKHGDVPLEPTAGGLIADVVVDTGASLVLQTTDFRTKSDVARFIRDFLDHLYRRLERDPRLIHVFMEEADEFAPQKPFKEETRMLSAVEQVVRRGRSRGLGMTMITQRSASLNKNVLEQTDILIAMRTTGPNDRKAIEGWVGKQAGGDDHGVIASLPGLENGDAWVWNPERKLLERIHVRARKTLDVSGRIAPGAAASRDAKLKSIDITALGGEIKATADRAKANDPAELRKRIRELERAMQRPVAAEQREPEVIVEQVEVEIPVLSDGQVGRLENAVHELRAAAAALAELGDEISTACARASGRNGARASQKRVQSQPTTARPVSAAPRPRTRPDSDRTVSVDQDGAKFGKGERTVLGVLAEYPDGRTVNELAFLAGYSAKASTIGVILSNLRKLGLVEPGNQPVRPTAEGLAAAGGPIERPTGQALLEQWLRHPRIGEGERRVLLQLLDLYPQEPTHDELCELTGYSPTASTMGVILSKLRKLGLVEKGARRVTPEFVEAVAA